MLLHNHVISKVNRRLTFHRHPPSAIIPVCDEGYDGEYWVKPAQLYRAAIHKPILRTAYLIGEYNPTEGVLMASRPMGKWATIDRLWIHLSSRAMHESPN
jgi:hypothetical protein